MNELYQRVDGRRRRPAVRRAADDVTGVVIASAKKTFFAGGNLKSMVQATPGRRRRDLRDGRGDQGRPAPARDATRARSSPRSTAPRSAAASRSRWPANHRIAVDDRAVEIGLPEVDARPAARRRRRHPRRTHARPPDGADGRAAARAPGSSPRPRWPRAWSTSWSPTREELLPGREGVDPGAPRRPGRGDEPVGPRGLQDARRHPEDARRWPQFLPAFPALLRKQTKGADLPRAARDPVRRGRGRAGRLRHRHRGSRSRYFTNLVVGQSAKNMIQAFFFDLQAINSGSLRPQGIEPLPGHQGRRPRRRDDGRRHRLLVRPRRHAGRAQGRRRSRPPRRARPTPRSCSTRRIARGKLDRGEGATSCSAGSPPTADPADLAGCDLVIEAVFEDPALKAQGVRRDRRRTSNADALLCSNTSTLPITELADGRRPAGRLHRPALLQPRRQDAAGRDHPRRGDLRRGAGQGVRRRASRSARRRSWSTTAAASTPRGSSARMVNEGLAMLAEGVHPVSLERAATPGRLPGRRRCSSPTSSTWS